MFTLSTYLIWNIERMKITLRWPLTHLIISGAENELIWRAIATFRGHHLRRVAVSEWLTASWPRGKTHHRVLMRGGPVLARQGLRLASILPWRPLARTAIAAKIMSTFVSITSMPGTKEAERMDWLTRGMQSRYLRWRIESRRSGRSIQSWHRSWGIKMLIFKRSRTV